MAPSIDPSQWTYTDYVCFLRSHGFHNLAVLDEYLQWGADARASSQLRQPTESRTMLLEFAQSTTRISDLSDLTKLRLLLKEWTRTSSNSNPTLPASGPAGRIILIEDASPKVVDTIGGILNIEPSFFASHITDSTATNPFEQSYTPTLASSSASSQSHSFSVEYPAAFMPIGCGKEVDLSRLFCEGNYRRKLEVTSKQGKQKTALARRKISFYMKKTLDPWLCIVLVDPPVSVFSLGSSDFRAVNHTRQFEVAGVAGGYLDFIEPTRPQSKQHHDFRDCRKRFIIPTPFDDLIRHWQLMARENQLLTEPRSTVNIMRPAFKIAASECANYFTYVHTILENSTASATQSISPAHHPTITTDPPKLRRHLDRCIFLDSSLSRYKPILAKIKDFVHTHTELREDFRCLLIDLHHHRATCDSQIQHITSLLQSHSATTTTSQASETSRQADYMRYLAIIALIYVPFSLACAIFSMPAELAPARHYLSGFLPVTAGITLIFLLLVLPESRDRIPAAKDRVCGGLSPQYLLGTGRAKRRRKSEMASWDSFDSTGHRTGSAGAGSGGTEGRKWFAGTDDV